MESTLSTASSTKWTTTTLAPFTGLPLSASVRVLVSILGWLACVTGVFGNILIITTLLSQPALRSLHNLYIGNLAIADLVVVGYCVPFWLLDLSLGYMPVANQQHCDVNSFTLFVCLNASLYTLVLIGFNRYICVCHPGVYAKIFSKTNTIVSCVVVWVISASTSSLPFFHVENTAFVYSSKVHLCSYNGSYTGNLFTIISVISIVLPTIFIGFFSFSIFRYWTQSRRRTGQWTQNQRRSQAENQSQSQRQKTLKAQPALSSANMALIRSLVLVFLLLVLLCIPLSVTVAITGSVYVSPDVYAVFVLFFFLNNSINWIVYGLLNKNFRNGYRRLLVARCASSKATAAEVEGTGITLATVN